MTEEPEGVPLDEGPELTSLGTIKFDSLSPTAFEEFVFDLMTVVGFKNVDWRKGTPKAASPADRGRDIVAELDRIDVDGHSYTETWFVDCKHYDRGVPPDVLQGTVTWAQAERPDTVLYVASGYLTNGAKDWVATYQKTQPPFRIRVWEAPQLRQMVEAHLDVAFRHDVEVTRLRRVSDILTAASELEDKLWYGRKPDHDTPLPADLPPEIVEGMRSAMREMEAKYGLEELASHTKSDWDWGFLSGKVSAIRWVLGDDWDMLDS